MHARVVLSGADAQCATFFRPDQPDLYVGYRFIEHDPEMCPQPLSGHDRQPVARREQDPVGPCSPLPDDEANPWDKGWTAAYDEANPDDDIQLKFNACADGSARASGQDLGGRIEREFHFEPVEDGVLMWMKLTTSEDLPGACAVQQCLRFSGTTAVEWRRQVAQASPLSEYDLQSSSQPNDTLTWVRQRGDWLNLPVPQTVLYTPGSRALVAPRGSGEADHGLIVRQARDASLAAGMYWERTAYLSNRHTADCVHSAVDFGPLAAGDSRTLRGRFYLIEGNKDALLSRWEEEFA